ncbi:hypothetical protein L6452_38782 [Arctium lappa]|uniref:Uncharacterized protein n=1 Tax=Arctium lappa TaxID=4217 RepID=A0ACB8XQG8_ARCLA|nr:hypothetical protein L6452_38782 [Arctium lappa]
MQLLDQNDQNVNDEEDVEIIGDEVEIVGEGRELVLYVNEEVEPRVAKPMVATREEILLLTGLDAINVIDLSSDEEETANEKYENFWKV